MTNIKLLPCPFCGGNPSIRIPEDTDGYTIHVACRCGVTMLGSRFHFSSAEEAASAWNTRTCNINPTIISVTEGVKK